MKLKQIFLIILILIGLKLKGQEPPDFKSNLQTDKKPWTNLNFYNNPEHFQFAIVTDRTGGPRPGIFEDAVKKLNWLMPEFVISVGDLIRGASGEDKAKLDKQWAAHFERIKPLKMPFFHLAGNHDIKANNEYQVKYWNKLFGSPFYSFTYKNVLFLCLFSNEGTQVISEKQLNYFKKVLAENKDVRWTMVFLHHPLWLYPHMSNFDKIENLLADRKYSVFAGHQHRYLHTRKNNANYYVLATTGGGSGLRGNGFGEFDHITWVTMGDQKPIIANLRLDGILPHDISNQDTYALSQSLMNALEYKKQVLVDSEEDFSKGKVYLSFENTSDQPLYLDGRFFHNHWVNIQPNNLKLEIPPHSTKMHSIDIEALKSFSLKENVFLEFEATLGYHLDEHPGFELSGIQTIELKPSSVNLLASNSIEYTGTYTLKIEKPFENASIYYTLDGSEPTDQSILYEKPVQISQKKQIKAIAYNSCWYV